MPKRTIQIDREEHFGARLAKLRMEAGYSQRDLAKELGISQRMIAYYEKETKHPPTHLLPLFAEALGVSTEACFPPRRTPSSSPGDSPSASRR